MKFAMDYELFVIGAGPGGYEAALYAAQLGARTAVAEKTALGGTCLNRGCIPTKSLLHSAELYRSMLDSEVFGIKAENVTADLRAIYEKKDSAVEGLRNGIALLFKKAGIELFSGEAFIRDAHTVEVCGKSVTAENILIATGSVPFVPDIEGIKTSGVLTSDELLLTDCHDYGSITIIGGGVIGMEFATFYADLGREVTVIEAMPRVLPSLERELSQSASLLLKKKGVTFFTGSRVTAIHCENGKKLCTFTDGTGKENTVSSDAVLCAIGRRANADTLFPEDFIKCERGHIVTDESFRTSVTNIYAVGDVRLGAVKLAHAATAEGLNAVANILGKAEPKNMTLIPSCIYTKPEIATVGLTQDEAKERALNVNCSKYLMSANGRTAVVTNERGFVKLVTDAQSGQLLGASLMCENATDIISELALAIEQKLTARDIAALIHPHPTFAEAVCEATGWQTADSR